MEEKTNSKKLETIFFSTLDALRGVWDSGHSSNTLLTIIFHQRISSLDKEGLIDFLDFKSMDKQCWKQFAGKVVQNHQEAVDELLQCLDDFSGRNGRLKNIFLPFKQALNTEKKPQLLLQFLITLEEIDCSSTAISIADFGLLFNELLYRTALSGGINGKKRTSPPSINQLFVALCKPKGGEIIYDPTAGQGSSLISFVHQLPNIDIIATEENPQHHALCSMNLIVNGVYHADVQCADALTEVLEENIKVDCAVAHFPFGQYINTSIIKDQQYLSIPFDINTPRLNCNALFVQKILSKLNKVGKMMALMPINFLSNDGEDKKIKRIPYS
jgi:type I restriction enzyme M protein